jgi:glycosyltransferase (activator-dependent family)
VRVLFASYAEKTHFLPMVPLAWALRTAGHEVRVASQPELAGVITQAGLTAVPVGRDHKLWQGADRLLSKRFAEVNPEAYERLRRGVFPPYDMPDDPAEVTWEYLAETNRDIVKQAKGCNATMIEELVAYARHWRPDLVVWEQTSYSGGVAAKAVGAAHARLLWGFDYYGRWRTRFLQRRPADDRTDPLADWLREQAGEFSEDLVTGHFSINQLPASLRVDAGLHYVPMRHTPYGGRAVIPSWLWQPAQRPRVAITLGSTSSEKFGGYLVGVQEILDSLAELDIEIVATIADSQRDTIERVPDNARIVPYAPLHALAPTCSVIIHHAGAGTMATATQYAVPQLILPDQADGWYTARRTGEVGAALVIEPREATGELVRDAVVRLLGEESFRRDVTALRDEMLAMPAPNEVVGELEALAAKYSTKG